MARKRKNQFQPRDDEVRFDALRTWEEVAAEATKRGIKTTPMGALKTCRRALAKLKKAFADHDWIEIKV